MILMKLFDDFILLLKLYCFFNDTMIPFLIFLCSYCIYVFYTLGLCDWIGGIGNCASYCSCH